MSKYRNRKITRDGDTFDSVKEYRRWCELKLLERAGEIHDLQRQVKFELIPAQYETTGFSPTGKAIKKCVERSCVYVADFAYKDEYGEQYVEDTKGLKTKDYIIKRKLMRWVHGIGIKEV